MKVEYTASDTKQGFSLQELSESVQRALGLAEANGTNPNDAKVSVLVNWSAGIKKLTMEV